MPCEKVNEKILTTHCLIRRPIFIMDSLKLISYMTHLCHVVVILDRKRKSALPAPLHVTAQDGEVSLVFLFYGFF